MVYTIMKGVILMFFDFNIFAALINPLPVPMIALIIIITFFLLFGLSLLRRSHKKKKSEPINTPSVTQPIYSPKLIEELNQTIEPYGFAYESDQDIFYSIMYPWQREMGYCRLYDEASAILSMIIDCEPITFEYDGKKWLIEFWKGQYGMNTGGEVGIYYTTGIDLNIPDVFNGTFYYCVKDEDRINMYFVLRKNGKEVFSRNEYHWWLTGFKLGEFSDPSELSMEIVLELYNEEMVEAFTLALQEVGYKEDEYAVNGNLVIILFNKPHSEQPLTRNAVLDYLMQQNNKNLCDSYQTLTKGYTNSVDKLNIIRREAPELYAKILNIGKPKAAFEAYDTINNYLNKN